MRNSELMKYASMATVIIATLGVAIFLGIKIDAYFNLKFPITTILFPMVALCSFFYKVYINSSRKK